MSIWCAAITALFVIPRLAHATTIPITNHSFEDPVTGPGTFVTNTAPNGWSAYGSINFSNRAIGVLNPNDTSLYADGVPDDHNVGVVFLLPSAATESGLQQTLGDTLQASTQYTLSVEVGNIANDPNPPHNSFNFSGFPGYRVDLLAGSAVIASDNNTLAPGEGRFLTSTVQLTTGASHPNEGQALAVRLVNLDGPAGIEVNFDNVRLDAVPAPAATATPTPTATAVDTPTAAPTNSATPQATPGCPATPRPDCKTPVAGKGKLALTRVGAIARQNSAAWSWRGQATSIPDLGTPLTTSSYRLCVYDAASDVVLELLAAAASDCAGRPCWKSKSTGFKYSDRQGQAAGLGGLTLKSGADGRAAIKLKAKGVNLALPDLPLDHAPEPVRVVLINEESGVCWSAAFSSPISPDASTSKWVARND